MSDSTNNMVLYVGAYADEDSATNDYEAMLTLRAAGAIGAFDAGVVSKDADGKMDIKRHTSSTSKGTWTGMAAGAVLGLIFPPSILGAGIVGAGTGAAIGHSMNNISKDDLKDLGDLLSANESALIVIGESEVEKMIKEAVKSATKEYTKEFEADSKDFEKQLKEAEKELESEDSSQDSSTDSSS